MKKLLKKSAVAGALALACSSGAQAADIDWLVLNVGDAKVASAFRAGSFEDRYSFELTSASTDVSSTVAFDLSTFFNITGGSYALYDKGPDGLFGGDDTVLGGGPWSFGATTHQVDLSIGKYYFDVIGNADGSIGGAYTIATFLVPIPEPEIYAMMAAGLGLMGFIVRRRKGQAAA